MTMVSLSRRNKTSNIGEKIKLKNKIQKLKRKAEKVLEVGIKSWENWGYSLVVEGLDSVGKPQFNH